MNLRPYQERAVTSVLASLKGERPEGKCPLLVAATGAGKTVMMAHIARRYAQHLGRPINVLVLQHRRELVSQNRKKFQRVNRDWCVATFSGSAKVFARPNGYAGAATFATTDSLRQPSALKRLPIYDLVLVDECHHAAADSWGVILKQVRQENEEARLCGVTATPERADRKTLADHFDHVADIITIAELVQEGWLVRPVGMVCEGVGAISAPGAIDAVIAKWRDLAGARQTAAFCETIADARFVCGAFNAAGVKATVITGEDNPADRDARLALYAKLGFQVVVNVGTLTEGWDDQQTACILLLRETKSKGLLIQIIGRGLRIVDPEEFPEAAPKDDCLIVDFTKSLDNLGGLAQALNLNAPRRKKEPGPPPMKPCAECRRAIPLWATACPLCGYVYPEPKAEETTAEQGELIDPNAIVVRPYEFLLAQTLFAWLDLPDRDGRARGRTKIAAAGKAWALATSPRDSGRWFAFGATEAEPRRPRHLATGSLDEAMSHADAFLAREGDAKKYGRGSFFMRQAPSPEQLALARGRGIQVRDTATMYEVSCWLSAGLARPQIAAMMRDLDDASAGLEEAA